MNDGSQFQAGVTWGKEETDSLSSLVSRRGRSMREGRHVANISMHGICLWSGSDGHSVRN